MKHVDITVIGRLAINWNFFIGRNDYTSAGARTEVASQTSKKYPQILQMTAEESLISAKTCTNCG